MKKIILLASLALSFSSFAAIKYECLDPSSLSLQEGKRGMLQIKFLKIYIDNDFAAEKNFGYGSIEDFKTPIETAINHAIKYNKKVSLNYEVSDVHAGYNEIEISVNDKCTKH